MNRKEKTKSLGRISDEVHKAVLKEARAYRSVDAFIRQLLTVWNLSKK